jgi:predicted GH43/DUF377 family glycosyl hydrolase
LGPLGAAVNRAALRRQLTLLKDMGCDAIRTTHNMPAPELVELCDEMGFMMIIEPFDEWDIAKCANGYHRFFNEWVEKDMVNMLRHFRNNPCVVMWSIGNEVPTQCSEDGYKVAALLQNICHREDPTRPVTCGMDQADCALNNGFAALLDIPGFNYRLHKYREAYEKLPQNLLLGSETASTISSRGVYKFPVEKKAGALYDDHQCSSYDLEYCRWSNLPDDDFAWADDYEWMMGQFVWTGFDYLGEPTPYDANGWPNHSSMFGIIDLANIPKDRYYLYRSIWNKNENTLHILPHWNWEGREGQTTPVFVYTGYPSAELFINGKSQGKQTKNNSTLQNRYRLMWMDAIYEPGEVKVVAYDAQGKAAEEKTVRTAGKPHHIELLADRTQLSADGKDLAYINVRVEDKDGNLCPNDGQLITFSVKGAGTYRAAANGDPTCLDLFHKPQMHAFGGQLTAIVQSAEKPGKIQFEAEAKGLGKATVVLQSEEKTAYLFSYFKNNGKDGLHLAYSSDGYHWEALNNDQAFLKPELSNDKLMRDPCIIQGNDGLYHLVWTISWEGKGIGYAASKDLISWSEQKIIPVMAHEEGARNCWAPEITYDKANNEYMIYWATTITGRYPSENQQSEDAYNHRIYYVTTRDFTHFSKTKLLYDTGVNVIDATIVPIEGRFVMFLKDETLAPPQKNIRIATSEKLTGPYSELSAPVTGNYWAEGPTVTTIGENWVVYFDKYREGKFGAITSADLKNWKDISDKISLPTGIRHGTIFKVPESSAPLPIRSLRGI